MNTDIIEQLNGMGIKAALYGSVSHGTPNPSDIDIAVCDNEADESKSAETVLNELGFVAVKEWNEMYDGECVLLIMEKKDTDSGKMIQAVIFSNEWYGRALIANSIIGDIIKNRGIKFSAAKQLQTLLTLRDGRHAVFAVIEEAFIRERKAVDNGN